MISKATKLTKQGYRDAFVSLVSFAAIVMVSVYEIASSQNVTRAPSHIRSGAPGEKNVP